MTAAAVAQGAYDLWQAELHLEFEKRGGRSVLARRSQRGPLTLQKPLYPEGDGVCHCMVLHPPGGIAAGDELLLTVRANEGAHVLITTPGATKWYRCDDTQASQNVMINVGNTGICEWLPQENIFFHGARASSTVNIKLAGNAVILGWDISCLGRPAAAAPFESGALRLATRIERDGELLWIERAGFTGTSALLQSPIGMQGHTVFGTAYLAGVELHATLIERLREEAAAPDAITGITALPNLLFARYLGDSAQQAREYFCRLRAALRQELLGLGFCEPRIWNT